MRIVAALVGVSVVFAASFIQVFAHAEPATIKPGDGAVLVERPLEVVITMSQDMFDKAGANDIDVVNESGVEVTTVSAALDRTNRRLLSVALPSTLPPGKYTVKWKTLSADDGDSAEGTRSFTFDPAGTAAAGQEQLREDVLGDGSSTDDEAPTLSIGGAEKGVTWVLVVAVGIGMFVLGAGGTFLLVQRKP